VVLFRQPFRILSSELRPTLLCKYKGDCVYF
jgi:hypothetical protein